MLDLIVPVYRNATLTRRCLDSILKNWPDFEALKPRLIIINDSPDDQSVLQLLDEFARDCPQALILNNLENKGFVKTVNRGLLLAIEEEHDAIVINSDTETFAGTIPALLAAAHADPTIGFASPRSNNAAICSLPHCQGGKPVDPETAYIRWKIVSASMPLYHFAPTAVGFYLWIKYQVLADIGLLSEDFGFGYEEENDLIQRANSVGYRAVIANHAFAYHAGSASFAVNTFAKKGLKSENLELIKRLHPHFIKIVDDYIESPHFRAENLLSELVPDSAGRYSLCLDLSEMGTHHNGTNELAKSVVGALYEWRDCPFEVTLLCSKEVMEAQGIPTRDGLRRADPRNPGRYTVALRLGQPFHFNHVERLEQLAPINVYGMLDVIAVDVGVISTEHNPGRIWRHLAKNSNGFFYISRFAEKTFHNRFPAAQKKPGYVQLLPTRLDQYLPERDVVAKMVHGLSPKRHILVLGNHYPHKASVNTAKIIQQAFPNLRVVVLGDATFTDGNLESWRSGTLEQDIIDSLFSEASVVVLPSFMEGFGFGLVHALAAGKPVVARNIPATQEILSTYGSLTGVHLFDHDLKIISALENAFTTPVSEVDDRKAVDWATWTAGLIQFCMELTQRQDTYTVLEERIMASDSFLRAHLAEKQLSIINERTWFESLFFRRASGRPIRPLRRLMFHKSGKPRSVFRKWILRPDGLPRRPFQQWMTKSSSARLPRSEL
jgi:GT2 family glycosyltransferase